MPQMNTVLLAPAEASTEKQMVQSNKLDANSSENKDFSLALAQASSPKSSNSKAVVDENDADKFANLASDTQETQEDGDDVSHVLAQINLATQLAEEESIAVDGAQLPLADGELDEQAGSQSDISANVATVGTELLAQNHDIALSDSDKLAADNRQLNVSFIEQLTAEQLDNLVNETGLDKEQLLELPPQMLQTLMTELDKLTALGAGQPISIPTELKSLIEQANKLIAAKAIDPQGASQSLVNLSNHDKSAASGVAASETLVSTSKVVGDSAEGKSILGEAKGESSTKSGLTPAQIAETSSQNSGSQNSGSLSHGADLKTAKLAVVMTSGAEGLDIDTAQSESKPVSQGLNNPAFIRSEAQVQYQVSIKPSGEPAQQMQEMIQKFSPVMQQQLLTMVKQGVQHAEIRLDPPELGHMMVRIQVHGDQTQVQFQVMQHQTKDLVEQAIPRLRELLAEQGMQLTDSNVSQGGSGREQDAGDGNSDQGHGFATDVDEIAAEESLLASNNATSYRSGIDYYA